MNLSPLVAEWAADYEQEHGLRPAELVLQIAEHILKVGDMLKNRGEKDAQEGVEPYSAAVFPALVAKIFRMEGKEDYDVVQTVADLWRSNYMDGYEEGGIL